MKKCISILLTITIILLQIAIYPIKIANAEIKNPVFKGYFQNVDYSNPDNFLQTGKQTEITPRIKKIADSINNKEELNLIATIYNEVKKFPISNHHEHDFFNNTADQLLDSGLTGCNDWGIAFASIARAKKIPTVFVQAARMDWVEDYLKNSDHQGMFRGHIMVECYVKGEWYLVDSQAGRIYLNYNRNNFSLPDGEYAFSKSIEVFDMGTIGEAQNTLVMRNCFKNFYVNKYKDPCYSYYLINSDGSLTFHNADAPFILKTIKETPLIKAGLILLENGTNYNLINYFVNKFHPENYYEAWTLNGFLHTDLDDANLIIFHDLSVSDKNTFKNIYEYPYVKTIFPEIDTAKPGDIIVKKINGKTKILFVTYGKDKSIIDNLSSDKAAELGITKDFLINNPRVSYGENNNNTQNNTQDVLLKPAEMEADLNQLLDILSKVHPKTINGFSTAQQGIITKIRTSIKKDMTKDNFYFLLNELFVSFNDGHTSLGYNNINLWLNIPIIWLDDGIYISEDTQYFKKGSKIISMGNKNESQLFNGLEKLVPSENQYWIKEKSKMLLTMAPFLYQLGVVNNNAVNIKVEQDGNIKDINMALTNNHISYSQLQRNWVGWSIDKELSLGIFYLDQCKNDDEYNNNLKDFFEAVSKNGIKNIAVDLRYNTGGDSSVIDSFLSYTKIKQYKWYDSYWRYSKYTHEQLNWEPVTGENKCANQIIPVNNNNTNYNGNIYILTGSSTFSSALMFAEVIKANHIGKIIGEPTGNSPSHYGYPLNFTLNNSKFNFTASHVKWDCPSQDNANTLYPDIQANITINNILNNTDPAIQTLMNLCSNNTSEYLYITKTVAPDKIWTIKFNKSIKKDFDIKTNQNTINIRDSNGNLVPISVQFNDSSNELIVKPLSNYTAGETYYLTIGLGIKSTLGESLAKPVKVKFTVEH